MAAEKRAGGEADHSEQVTALPADVAGWLKEALAPNEEVAACLFSDILANGEFGENWTFLTDKRLFVLCPNGAPDKADLRFELPTDEIETGFVRDYVGSSELIVRDRRRGYEVARFSLASHPEASDLCHCLKELVQKREAAKARGRPPKAVPRRRANRCEVCGAAVRHNERVCRNCLDKSLVTARLLRYLYPYRWIAVVGLALTLALTAMQLAPPYLTKILVDDVFTGGDISMLKLVIVALIATHIGRAVVTMFRTYIMSWLSSRVLMDLRVRVFDHLQMLPLTYYNQRQTGEIMSRVTSDLQRLQYFIAEGFQDVLVNITTIFLIAAILLWLDWRLALLAFAPVPTIAISTAIFGRKIHLLYHRTWRRTAKISAILTDTIPGIRVVKSFAQERRESERFSETSDDLYGQELKVAKLSSGFFPLLGLMTGLGSILIFGVGGYMVLQGDTTVGTLIAFTGYLWQFYMPIQNFGQINQKLQHCVTSAERVFEILDNDVEPLDHPGGLVLRPLRGHVEFRNVQFSYEPGKHALDQVSFTVEPGEMIGLVGPSGAGKSTLVHLIARFYDTTEGQILIDGHPIEDLDLRTLREQIGVVLQEPYLFHGTVWQNIAYANQDATADEIIAAARAANAHDIIIRLPDGYDTVIGERGQTLSGGERQRLSIARAILRNPRILILDEATASVDTETEVLIQMALERLVRNRTTFAIAHRLSTLRKAHRLFVFERGRLVEHGTHGELLESNGLYRRLVDAQSQLSKMRAW
ncbi:MAG: ABC transporter ATP-binding protein [Candidatus Sumerlaeota bacterium]|nr:ABC transporter ATP-binding protein [Candidatus Sumerlaeota bacterium]